MSKHTLQIPSDDGCVYVYDADTNMLSKLCPIHKDGEIPKDVAETLRRAGLTIYRSEK